LSFGRVIFNPFYGIGEAAIRREAVRLCDLWNGQWSHHLNESDIAALLEANRLHDLTCDWSAERGWFLKEPMPEITPEMVNTWSISGMGHDGINAGVCIEAACQRQGQEMACQTCQGVGVLWPSEELKAAHEAWARTEPPAGEAYQLWKTVSEGSPLSPPFETPTALAVWLATHRKKDGNTVANWLTFIEAGWAPTLISFHTPAGGHVALDGVKAVIKLEKEAAM
jgi:hypothetical protein